MRRTSIMLAAIVSVLILSGCASSGGYKRSASKQIVEKFYARVERVDVIQYESQVGQGAAIGAIDGFVHNIYGSSEDRIFGALFGAFVGAVVTTIVEGDTTGYEYELQDLNGEYLSVILDNREASVGDCVIVTIAGDIYIKRQPDDFCYE